MFAGLLKCWGVLVLGLCVVDAGDLPPYIEKCKINDPNLNKCLLEATEKIRPYLIKGIPELNFTGIEPYNVREVIVEQGLPVLNFKATVKNMIVRGLSNYKFSKFDFDVPKKEFFLQGTVGPVDIDADFVGSGRVFLVQADGKGNVSAGIRNSNITCHRTLKIILRDGEEHIAPTATKLNMDVEDPRTTVNFHGNNFLSGAVNRVVGRNINFLFRALKPVIERIISNIVEDGLLKVLDENVPFKKLFPEE